MAKEPTVGVPGSTAAALATAKTDTRAFQESFKADPAAALKAKGFVLSPIEERHLAEKVRELRRRPASGQNFGISIDIEISIGIGISF